MNDEYMDNYAKWKDSKKKQGVISKLDNFFKNKENKIKEQEDIRQAYIAELQQRASNGDLIAYDQLKRINRSINSMWAISGLIVVSIILCILFGWYGYAAMVLIVLLCILARLMD